MTTESEVKKELKELIKDGLVKIIGFDNNGDALYGLADEDYIEVDGVFRKL